MQTLSLRMCQWRRVYSWTFLWNASSAIAVVSATSHGQDRQQDEVDPCPSEVQHAAYNPNTFAIKVASNFTVISLSCYLWP